jgi:hypothetical protein
MEKATLHASVSGPEDVAFQKLQGEALLLNLETGKYFGSDAVGMRVWHTLTEYSQLTLAYRALLERCDVLEKKLRQFLRALLNTLAAYDLLLSEDQPGTSVPGSDDHINLFFWRG